MIRLSRTPTFYVHHCQHDKALTNLPDAPDNVRVWTFVKDGNRAFSILCNGQKVGGLSFADAPKHQCMRSGWADKKVTRIKLNPDWDRTVGIREICTEPLPIDVIPGVVADEEPPVLFGHEVSLKCSDETMELKGAEKMICGKRDGSDYYWHEGEFPYCLEDEEEDGEGWRTQRKDVWFEYPWEKVPFEVKTTSRIGSNAEVFFEVADSGYSFARVVIRLSRTPIFYVHHCQHDKALTNLPDAPDNVRVWTFVKDGNRGFSILCNGQKVGGLSFADAPKYQCMESGWADKEVTRIKLNPDWDRTVGVREICTEPLPIKNSTGVVADENPPILFGYEISLKCSDETMNLNGADTMTCGKSEGSDHYSYEGEVPYCSDNEDRDDDEDGDEDSRSVSGGWRTQRKDVWFSYPWEKVPFEVKTTSRIGSNAEVFFEVADSGYSFARVVIRLSRTPIFYVHHCQHDKALTNLPDAPDNVRVWTFVKDGNRAFSILCNGQKVGGLSFADAPKYQCMRSGWADKEVTRIKLNPDWDRTVGIREICTEPLPIDVIPGVVADENPPVLFGDEISLKCSDETVEIMGADTMTCDKKDGSDYYTYEGELPSCSYDGDDEAVEQKLSFRSVEMKRHWSAYPPRNLVDGNLRNFAHSFPESNGMWVRMNLSYNSRVTRVKVYNRHNCCRHRIVGASVFVKSGADYVHKCGEITTIKTSYEFSCRLSEGDVVELSQEGRVDQWNIAEIEVYGIPDGSASRGLI